MVAVQIFKNTWHVSLAAGKIAHRVKELLQGDKVFESYNNESMRSPVQAPPPGQNAIVPVGYSSSEWELSIGG